MEKIMLSAFFNNTINTLIRQLDWGTRVLISFALFCVAIGFMILSIRKKNDKAPLSIGWFILSIIAILFGVLYVTL